MLIEKLRCLLQWNKYVHLKHYILILLFASLLYLNSLDADFTYDDNRAILNNQDLLSTTPWYHLFVNDFWGTPIRSSNSHGSYRPISVISFRLNHMIHGHTPFGFHLVNLLLHLLVIVLYTILTERLLNGRKRITLIASLLFASHPIHVESVTSIVGRADVGAALFYLLALFFYIKFVESNTNGRGNNSKYLYCTLILATFSMLTKEHGVTCLLICLVYHLFIVHRFFPFSKDSWTQVIHQPEFVLLRKGVRDITIALVLLAIFRLSLIRYRPSFAPADNPASDNQSVMVRFLTFQYLPVFNFWLLIYPQWLSFDWSMDAIPLIISWFDYRNLFTLIFYGTIFEFIRRIFNYYSLVSISNNNNETSNFGSNIQNHKKTCHRCEIYQSNSRHQNIQPSIIDDNNNIMASINYNHSNFNILSDLNNNNIESFHENDLVDNNNNHNVKTQKFHLNNGKLQTRNYNSNLHQRRKLHKLSEMDCLVLSMALTIIPFLPATNLFFYIGFVVAERILYIPSFGFCLFIAICIEKFIQYVQKISPLKYLIYFCYLILIIAFSVRTVLRNTDWLTEESLYRSGILINPPKAYGNLANILSLQGKLYEAEQTYKKALQYRFNMADVHYNLGLLLQNQERYGEAIQSYQQAIRFRPRLAMAYLNMGAIFARLGDKERAKKFYEKCSQLDNYGLKDLKNHEVTRISALYNLGRLYLEEENYISALEIYKRALFQIPSYYPAHSLFNMIGEVYHKLNRTIEAEIWFKKSLKVKRDHIPAYLTYAKMLIKLNRTIEAEQLYKKAMIFSPNEIAVYHHYGQFKMNNGQFSKAFDIYQRAFQMFPNDSNIVINMANILRELKKNKEAEKFYKMATELRPDDVITHSNLGAIYHLNGKLEMAKKSYLKALELKPNDNITKINLAKLDRVVNNNKL